MQWEVVETVVGNLSTNQRPAFEGKSQERDSLLIRSEGHLYEFTVPIWKQWIWLIKPVPWSTLFRNYVSPEKFVEKRRIDCNDPYCYYVEFSDKHNYYYKQFWPWCQNMKNVVKSLRFAPQHCVAPGIAYFCSRSKQHINSHTCFTKTDPHNKLTLARNKSTW